MYDWKFRSHYDNARAVVNHSRARDSVEPKRMVGLSDGQEEDVETKVTERAKACICMQLSYLYL